jgi:drug/metabolite transporter (DMT)-like permease
MRCDWLRPLRRIADATARCDAGILFPSYTYRQALTLVPISDIALTLTSVVLIGCAQILFKLAANGALLDGFHWRTLSSWISPSMIAALAVSIAATVVWVWVLRTARLGTVYPIYALTFVIVPLLDRFVFGTPFSPRSWLGAAAIIAGVWLMADA